jgi:hypothetical protein
MNAKLIQVPGVAHHQQTVWQIRVLEINGRDLVLPTLAEWSKSSPADYKKIMKVLHMIGQVDRIRDEKKVKKSKNPKHQDIYEIRADKGSARLMFFYCKSSHSAVICTNTYWKTKSSKSEQDAAFSHCARLKEYYEQNS